MKKILREFKEFALKSNVLDLAVAVIMGAAAGNMVSSLVDSVLMPLIGILLGGLDFSALSIQVGAAVIRYGMFLQSVMNFLIISLCVFFMLKGVDRLKHYTQQQQPTPEQEKQPTTDELLAEIRDLLKTAQASQGQKE